MANKPNCWECEYQRDVPGSAHIACAHPSVGERPGWEKVMATFASVGRAPPVVGSTPELSIRGSPHGIAHGWFNWPHNFDPVWLENCDGFRVSGVPAD